jgi:nicotinamide mononucleotide (NMN) deamidase PncC
VGTVYVAISTKDGEQTKLLHLAALRDRATIRTHAANEALAQIFRI